MRNASFGILKFWKFSFPHHLNNWQNNTVVALWACSWMWGTCGLGHIRSIFNCVFWCFCITVQRRASHVCCEAQAIWCYYVQRGLWTFPCWNLYFMLWSLPYGPWQKHQKRTEALRMNGSTIILSNCRQFSRNERLITSATNDCFP